MAEFDEAAFKAGQRVRQNEKGKTFDQTGHAIVTVTPEWERFATSLPANPLGSNKIQNADGTMIFMLGIDGLGDAPLG